MLPDDQPYCGVAMLPYATLDGEAAPILCTRGIHDVSVMHYCDEVGTFWAWQG
jgi:hypothetical protein